MRQPKWITDRDRKPAYTGHDVCSSARWERRARRKQSTANARYFAEQLEREARAEERKAQSQVPPIDKRLEGFSSIVSLKNLVLVWARKVEQMRKLPSTVLSIVPGNGGTATFTANTYYLPVAFNLVLDHITLYDAERFLKSYQLKLHEHAQSLLSQLQEITPDYNLDRWLEPRE